MKIKAGNTGSSGQRAGTQFNQTINTSTNEINEASIIANQQDAETASLQVSVTLEPRQKGASQHVRTHTEEIDSPAAPK